LQQQIVAQRRQFEAAAWSVGQRLYAERPFAFTHRFACYYAIWQENGALEIVEPFSSSLQSR
jgi:hypothetical protein